MIHFLPARLWSYRDDLCHRFHLGFAEDRQAVVRLLTLRVGQGHASPEDRHGPDGGSVRPGAQGRQGALSGATSSHRRPPLRERRRRRETLVRTGQDGRTRGPRYGGEQNDKNIRPLNEKLSRDAVLGRVLRNLRIATKKYAMGYLKTGTVAPPKSGFLDVFPALEDSGFAGYLRFGDFTLSF